MSEQLAQRLRSAADEHRNGDAAELRLSLNALMGLHGESSVAVLLVLLSVISVLPVGGVGTLMSLGMCAVAWAWVRGHATLALPTRLASVTLNERWTGRCLHGLAWLYEQSSRFMRPRWALCSHAGTRGLWGLWIVLMAFVIFLPLPLGNVLPSLSLILLSLGWMFRDGLALLLSALMGAAAMAYLVSLWHWVVVALTQAWQWLPA